jgi:hypothetical protein
VRKIPAPWRFHRFVPIAPVKQLNREGAKLAKKLVFDYKISSRPLRPGGSIAFSRMPR